MERIPLGTATYQYETFIAPEKAHVDFDFDDDPSDADDSASFTSDGSSLIASGIFIGCTRFDWTASV